MHTSAINHNGTHKDYGMSYGPRPGDEVASLPPQYAPRDWQIAALRAFSTRLTNNSGSPNLQQEYRLQVAEWKEAAGKLNTAVQPLLRDKGLTFVADTAEASTSDYASGSTDLQPVTQDTVLLQTTAMISAYNDFHDVLKNASNLTAAGFRLLRTLSERVNPVLRKDFAEIGITLTKTGQLFFDQSTLQEAWRTHPNKSIALLKGEGGLAKILKGIVQSVQNRPVIDFLQSPNGRHVLDYGATGVAIGLLEGRENNTSLLLNVLA